MNLKDENLPFSSNKSHINFGNLSSFVSKNNKT
jgi:hypothetical protein